MTTSPARVASWVGFDCERIRRPGASSSSMRPARVGHRMRRTDLASAKPRVPSTRLRSQQRPTVAFRVRCSSTRDRQGCDPRVSEIRMRSHKNGTHTQTKACDHCASVAAREPQRPHSRPKFHVPPHRSIPSASGSVDSTVLHLVVRVSNRDACPGVGGDSAVLRRGSSRSEIGCRPCAAWLLRLHAGGAGCLRVCSKRRDSRR